ncbi:DUF350 domain-containing protein [Roseomonas sp. CCTCC AB2023176]|uniref:DUF350 domain-containing protein n=1 Tax=Roseomonas sp. CCTCC AB2023176 TaxID=3342640 RepID=UPI0035DF2CBA
MNAILDALSAGLPVLLPQFALTLALLMIGASLYMIITPYKELPLIREGNAAAGVTFGGTMVALSLPLAATLATSRAILDVLLWGIVAIVLQLIVFFVVSMLLRGMRGQIEAGNVAAATLLACIQIAVAILNAAAMAG